VQQFLSGVGLRNAAISLKMTSLRKNPEEDVYVLGRDKNYDLVGIADITVEYKLTRGLSKVLNPSNSGLPPRAYLHTTKPQRRHFRIIPGGVARIHIQDWRSSFWGL